MIEAKAGDIYPVEFTADADLTGGTVTLWADRGEGPIELASTVTDAAAGVVTHTLDGTLLVGSYSVVLKLDRGGELITFPSDGFETLLIEDNI